MNANALPTVVLMIASGWTMAVGVLTGSERVQELAYCLLEHAKAVRDAADPWRN